MHQPLCASFKSLSSLPPLCLDASRHYGSPSSPSLFALDHIIVIDSGTSDACATGAGVLVHPPEPDHVVQCVISIPQYQLSNDADNPNGDDDTAHAPMSTHTPPQGSFVCAFPHLLRLYRCALAALALLPPSRLFPVAICYASSLGASPQV
jgi:hypothetical protein